VVPVVLPPYSAALALAPAAATHLAAASAGAAAAPAWQTDQKSFQERAWIFFPEKETFFSPVWRSRTKIHTAAASVGQEARTIGMWLVTWGEAVHRLLPRRSPTPACVAVESSTATRRNHETSTPLIVLGKDGG
jgi:hypothetical protein